jgi:outer membrane protein insertion porin family
MSKCRYLAALFVLVPALVMAAPAVSPEGKKVGGVEVVSGSPQDVENAQMVARRLQTRVGERFEQNEFDADLKQLSQQYERIEPVVEVRDNEVYVTLKVWPRPVIRDIVWAGNCHIAAKKLNRELGIKSGEVFDRTAFQKGFHKVKGYYIQKGYYDSQLDYRIVPVEGGVNIEIDVCEGKVGRIRKIVWRGFCSEEETALEEILITQEYSYFVSWLTEWGTYRPDVMEHDRMQVLRYLQDKGYADARVTVTTEETPRKNRIVVIFCADRGEMYHFGEVKVKGDLIFNPSLVAAQVSAQPEGHFSPDALHASVTRLTNLYGAKGYIEPQIQYQLHLRPEERLYDVEFTVEPGEVYKVGMVCISGNHQTQTRVILHESLVVPGEVFDIRKLKATEERLTNVGYFKSVRVYTSPTTEPALGPEYRDVHIEVEEESTGNLSVFAGFSTIDQVFGGGELTERNFDFKGIPTIFQKGGRGLRGAGEYFQARIQVGMKETTYLVKWTKPYFFDSRWIFGFDLEQSYNRQYSDQYQLDNTSGLFHATYPWNDYVRFGTLYRIRWSHEKTGQPQLQQANALISAVGGSVTYDSTNHMTHPTAGTRSELLLELAGVGGDNRFISTAYLNSIYVPIIRHLTLKWRADLRFLQPYGGQEREDIARAERLFLGGETTVRGYRSFIIGPKKHGAPIGGLSSILLSEEAQYRFARWIATLVFVDAGMVSKEPWDVKAFRVSAGFGARLEVLPSMPLTLGMGWPLNARRDSDIQRFFFAVGARF